MPVTSRTAVVLSHVQVGAELGTLGPWLDDHGFAVTRLLREDAPDLPDADLLIVMGSPSSVAAGHRLPPAQRELDQVADWVAADRAYFGICFGAQVLALVHGGTVTRREAPFIGYVNLDTDPGSPAAGPWVLWHNDAITAPPSATVLGSLDHADLVFRQGRAWGTQPHIEVDVEIMGRMGIDLGATPDVYAGLVDGLRHDPSHGQRSRALLDAFYEDVFA